VDNFIRAPELVRACRFILSGAAPKGTAFLMKLVEGYCDGSVSVVPAGNDRRMDAGIAGAGAAALAK